MRPLDPRLLTYAAATRAFLVTTGVFGLATAIALVAQAYLLADVIASAFLGSAGLAQLRTPLELLAGVVLVRAGLAFGQERAARRAAVRVQLQLRERLLQKVFQLGPAWLTGQRSAELAELGSRGVGELDGYFSRYLPQLVLAGTMPVVVLAFLLPADLTAFLIVLLTLPLIPVFMALVGLTTREATARQWLSLQVLGHHFHDVVTGLPTLKAYGRAHRQAAVVARVTADYRRATMRTLRLAFLSSLVLELLATLSVALVAVAVGLRLVARDLDLRTALMVLILAPEAYLPLRAVGAAYHTSSAGLASAAAIFDILELDVDQPVPAKDGTPAGFLVDVEDLVLRRPGRPEPVLRGVRLQVHRGEVVVVVGPSGAGKSTLVDAILGFLPPESGRVALAVPAGRIGAVGQRPHVFAGTVADNVRLGAPDATDADVTAALAAAGRVDRELPDGARTAVGDGGFGLSVGQVRRLALARALVRDPDLLILDEPTAGLDAQSEALVVATLQHRRAGQSVLVVTHRPALLALADTVVTLEAAPTGASARLAGAGSR